MIKTKKLPTIIGIFLLVTGVIAGVFLVNKTQTFKLGANVESIPKGVRISNVTNTSITVTWVTDIESSGFVKWGTSQSSLSKVALEENSEKKIAHSVTINGVEPSTDIYFKINSDSKDYDNNGTVWAAKTLSTPTSSQNSVVASGVVLMSDGSSPANAIIYLTINGVVLSSLTSNEGSFILPINTYVGQVGENTAIDISINGGINGTSTAIVYPKAVNSMPVMVLGRSYDFRTLEPQQNGNLPESTLSIPESVEKSSRFEVSQTTSGSNNINTVKIESVDDGEIINTDNPEFFGTGPQNTDIEIVVESEMQSATISTTANGSWRWSPPQNLEPGEHTLTVKWRDASGILRTITRSFIVQAAEGPAFESTPSATNTPVATSTPTTPAATSQSTTTPTVKPQTTSTPMATLAPTPETGSLTPTLALFIMGVGMLIGSVFVYNKSNAQR